MYYFSFWLPEAGIDAGLLKILLYVLSWTFYLMILPYLDYYVLVPTLLFKKKYIAFISLNFSLIVLFSYVKMFVDALFLETEPKWLFSFLHFVSAMPYLFIFSLATCLLRLAEEWLNRLSIQEALIKDKIEAELKFLKAQINPHFLFNTLNNIYSLTYTQSPKAAPALLKLSEMLRYMLYDSNQQEVTIQQEVTFLNNYIEFMTLKERWKNKVHISISIEHESIRLPPLLFINFIENAFKHGNLEAEHSFIGIYLTAQLDQISFKVENTFNESWSKDHTSGIGIKNVFARLERLYPGKYSLIEHIENNVYTIHLNLLLS
jgi:hypothetical protein